MKLTYFFLGILMCVMVATGLNIYFLKQSEKGRPKPRLAAGWSAIVWGAPALMIATLPLAMLGVGEVLLTVVFWIGLIAMTLAGFLNANASGIGVIIRKLAGGLMVLTGVIHGAVFFDALSNSIILASDLGLVLGGLGLAIGPVWRTPSRANKAATPVPAE